MLLFECWDVDTDERIAREEITIEEAESRNNRFRELREPFRWTPITVYGSQEILIANCIGEEDKERAYELAQLRANIAKVPVWVYYQAGKWYTTIRFLDIRVPCDHQKQFDPQPISTPS